MFSEAYKRITISYKQTEGSMLDQSLRDILIHYGINLIPADSINADSINTDGIQTESEAPILRITKKGLILEDQGATFFFHPSMSLLRMVNILKGIGDRFLDAVALREGDSLLDATMGLASDTLIASWAVGEKGRVLALEYSPLIHILVRDGLNRMKNLEPPSINNPYKKQAWLEIIQASTRIETICAPHEVFLQELPDKSVDVVYFDPMFRMTSEKSSSIKPIKKWSHTESLSTKTIVQACRIARRRVVLKERRNSSEFHRLGFTIFAPSKYSSINFGVIELAPTGGEE